MGEELVGDHPWMLCSLPRVWASLRPRQRGLTMSCGLIQTWGNLKLARCFLFPLAELLSLSICKMGIVIVPFPFGLLQVLNKIVCVKPQAQCQAMVTVQFLVAVVGMVQIGLRHSMVGFWKLLLGISLQYLES